LTKRELAAASPEEKRCHLEKRNPPLSGKRKGKKKVVNETVFCLFLKEKKESKRRHEEGVIGRREKSKPPQLKTRTGLLQGGSCKRGRKEGAFHYQKRKLPILQLPGRRPSFDIEEKKVVAGLKREEERGGKKGYLLFPKKKRVTRKTLGYSCRGRREGPESGEENNIRKSFPVRGGKKRKGEKLAQN